MYSKSYSSLEAVNALSNSTSLSTARLKRANILRIQKGTAPPPPSPEASIYSTYLIIFSRVVSSGLRAPTAKRAPPTLSEVMNRLNLHGPSQPTSPLASSPQEELEGLQASTPPRSNHLLDTSTGIFSMSAA